MITPEWRPLSHEAGLASYSLRGGLASLRKANYADPQLYYGGFFQYTIGLERVMKLALIVDYIVQNGRFPSDRQFAKKYGHGLTELLAGITDVRNRLAPSARVWELPDADLTNAAISFLSDFAIRARYYNIDVLTGKAKTQDPVERWFSEVGRLLISKRKRPWRDVDWARKLDAHANAAVFQFETEDGSPIQGFAAAAQAANESEYVAKEGTFLCARIARHAISILVARGGQIPNEIPVPHFVEFFYLFTMDDAYLKRQKSFQA
ncbi:hypothetical protein [Streptomyces luteolus]|uniref:HEPN domain-containing protein n=1 Tax=Streptomyces luteolus TaxID=3043615 RepID=A0ABT6SZ41_9ACTN|nr:hypothetical protein [Streptomyces sp. B-S-A12]MDI3420866.1 hypothetical protein [Streptomyces sp. B-S-A12]